MKKEKDNKNFWGMYAKFYDAEVLRFSGVAYQNMYALMSNSLTKDMDVLEIATGTGLIAINIATFVHSVEATDFSSKMIETARKKHSPENVHFSVEDATKLSFSDSTFDAVIISNALHIMPDPQAVLASIKRVLKPGGLLIAPTFSHGHLGNSTWKLNTLILKLIGFETYSKWTPEEFVAFMSRNGFEVKNWSVLKAAFPLIYLEATMIEKKIMKKIKITVMKMAQYNDLIAEYENPLEHPCDMRIGQVFISNGFVKPHEMCNSAWESMSFFVKTLAEGGGNFYDGWMKNRNSAMISCNDGFRPVSFYIKALEEDAN